MKNLFATSAAAPLSLAAAISAHDSGFSFLRLVMALLVLVEHAFPLGGYGHDWLYRWSGGQAAFGALAVVGFFATSGFFITKSSINNDWLQYLWRRCLRILPAYWMVLCFAAFFIGPLVWKAEGLGWRTYFTRSVIGPFAYVQHNFFLEIGRYCIYDIFTKTTPYGLKIHESAVNGSLWTLIHELHCYELMLVFAICGVLRRGKILVPVMAFALLLLTNLPLVNDGLANRLMPDSTAIFAVRFTCIFLLGSAAALYAKQIPLDDRVGVLALLAVIASLLRGGWLLVGYPAFVYVMLWAAVRLPRPLRKIGSKNDYSYGLYLYGFPLQQTLAHFGAHKLGLLPFMALSVVVTYPCAFLSWHLVEKQAMSLKERGPGVGVRKLLEGWKRRDRLQPGLPSR